MKKYIPLLSFIFIVLCAFLGFVFASNLSQPPILKDEPLAEQQYLKELYDNHNKFEITTVAPNNNRRGEKGNAVIYNNAGTFELWVNSDGAATWQKI